MSKRILEEALGKPMLSELWTSACPLVLPVIPQDFALPATVAPALYMLRWNRRRGKGNFVSEFGNPAARLSKERAATALAVAEKLCSSDDGVIRGCDHSVEAQVLADLLLSYCFENKGHSEERDAPIQRVYPTHYFASWIDLPDTIAHLRGVPEFIVSTLRAGTRNASNTGARSEAELKRDPLISALGDGFYIHGDPNSRESDRFDETNPVGIDQLLTIRVAQCLGVAPNPQANSVVPQVSIVAERAHWEWYEDINVFLRAYGHEVPRLTLIPMLETGFAVGLTSVFLSTIELLRDWELSGQVLEKTSQGHWQVFVDCSAGVDRELRAAAEESMTCTVRQLQRLCIQFMCIKILAYQARSLRVPGFTRNDNPREDPIASLNILGALLHMSHDMSQRLFDSLDEKCVQIVERLLAEDDSSHVQALEETSRHPALRLGDYIVSEMGSKLQLEQLRKFLESCLMSNTPNGLAVRRATQRNRSSVEQRSITLSNTALDFLVHRHLRQGRKGTPTKSMSVYEFIDVLKTRYGFFIAEAPRGVDTPSDLLRRNRMCLERRLRDLGLLAGVNDAEAMKRLRPRYGDSEQAAVTEGLADRAEMGA